MHKHRLKETFKTNRISAVTWCNIGNISRYQENSPKGILRSALFARHDEDNFALSEHTLSI